MTKKDRVIAAIKKEPVESIPSGFSLHFPSEVAFGEKGVQAHLDFFKQTDTDICKIMNENLVPAFGTFSCAKDFQKIPKLTKADTFIQDQTTFTKRIMEKASPDVFMLGTLHGVVASSIHPLEKAGMSYDETRLFLLSALRENPKPVVSAMQRITDAMCALVEEYHAAGVQGIYYAALGAEKRYFTDEEFATWIAPLDHQILKTIKETGSYSFLHMCKDGLDLHRYSGCLDVVDVVNWGVYEAPFSLEEGRSLFAGKTLMGGLANRSGVLVDGSEQAIQSEVQALITQMGRTGFILGADCTLATEQDLQRVRYAVQACRR